MRRLPSENAARSFSRARDNRDITVPTGIPSTAAISSYRNSSTTASSSTSRCSIGNLPTCCMSSINSTRAYCMGRTGICHASVPSPSLSSDTCSFSCRASARWFTNTLCITVNSHARRSLPAAHSRRFSHARASASCTRSSARVGSPVNTRAYRRSRGSAARRSCCGSGGSSGVESLDYVTRGPPRVNKPDRDYSCRSVGSPSVAARFGATALATTARRRPPSAVARSPPSAH